VDARSSCFARTRGHFEPTGASLRGRDPVIATRFRAGEAAAAVIAANVIAAAGLWCARMSETPPLWDIPPAPLGSDPPAWR